MACKARVQDELKKRKLNAKYAAKIAQYKKELKEASSVAEKIQIHLKMQKKIPRNAHRTRLRNICMNSGRARGIVGDFGLSRMEFRKLVQAGFVPGIVKSSW